MNIFGDYFLPKSEIRIHSYRLPGGKKLSKPKELKGIKQLFSVNSVGNKGAWQIFIKDSDLWVKATDFYSPIMQSSEKTLHQLREDAGLHHGKKRFIYGDSWGSVINRQEVWFEFKGLMIDIPDRNSHFNDFYTHFVKQVAILANQEDEWHRFMYNDTHIREICENLIKYKKGIFENIN